MSRPGVGKAAAHPVLGAAQLTDFLIDCRINFHSRQHASFLLVQLSVDESVQCELFQVAM